MQFQDQNQWEENQASVKVVTTQRAEKSRKTNLSHKSFLIIIKFIPHIIGVLYVIYTILGLCGIDAIIIGYLTHMSLLSWIGLYVTSLIFGYCYVHRLPMYYILLNELITTVDYYCNIPVSTFNLLVIHVLLIFSLIMGYSIYYFKYKLK